MIPILLALIRRFEGCKLVAYLCPALVWTIGWGSTGAGITKGSVWTQDQADTRLDVDAQAFYLAAIKASPRLAMHPEAAQAVADFCYNLGLSAYKASALKKRIDAGDWDWARDQLGRWVHGGGRRLPGLVLRRAAEAEFLPYTN